MRCETVDASLLDFCTGGLTPTARAEIQVHLDGCQECRDRLRTLEDAYALSRWFPQEEAPSRVAVALQQAAIAKIESKNASTSLPSLGARGSFLRRVRSAALGPQVAMAAVLVLAVGMGLWYVPRLGSPSTSEAGPVVSSEVSEGTEATLSPAAPLALELNDEVPTRQRTSEELPPAPTYRSAMNEKIAAAPPVLTARPADEAWEQEPVEEAQRAVLDLHRQVELEDDHMEFGQASPTSTPQAREAAGGVHGASELSDEGTLATAEVPANSAGSAARVTSRSAPRPSAAPAAAPPESLSEEALQQRVRSAFERGDCLSVSQDAQSLFRAHPGSESAKQVLLYAAQCELRLGRLDAARQLAGRAEQVPAFTARAQRLQQQIHEAAQAREAAAVAAPTSQ